MLVPLLVLQTALAYPEQTANQTADEDIAFEAFDAGVAARPTISNSHTDTMLISQFKENVDPQKKCNELQGEFLPDVKMCAIKHYRQSKPLSTTTGQPQPDVEHDPEVEDFEEDQVYQAMRTPNDPGFSGQWGPQEIDGPEAWNLHIGEGRSDIVVAVIDTGVDYTHPDLVDQMWVDPTGKDKHGYNFYADNNDPKDGDGHGTHCAGIIAASSNKIGVAGMIWKGVKIMALKFLGEDGGTLLGSVRSLQYAIDRDVTISSNSFGGGGRESSAMRRTIRAAREKNNHKFFAAAGNDGTDNDQRPVWPCNMAAEFKDTVICVASTTRNKRLSSFSNFGDKHVTIACPGSRILSTTPGNSYERLDGTSMATPMCAGTFTLAASYNPGETLDVIREKMMETVEKTRGLERQLISGGQANAFELLKAVGSGDGTTTERPRPTTTAPAHKPTTTERPRPTTTAPAPKPTTSERPRPTTTAAAPKPTTTERPSECKDNLPFCPQLNCASLLGKRFCRKSCDAACGESSAQDAPVSL